MHNTRVRLYILLLMTLLTSQLSATETLRVTIDPGHGGSDLGAVYASIKEADLVLKVSEKLKQKLKTEAVPFEISMTRTTDNTMTLQDRVEIAKRQNSELFISLHANAVKDHRVKGIELFFQNSLPFDEDNQLLAQQENQVLAEVHENIATQDPSKKNDIKMILEDLHRQHKIRSSLKFNQILYQNWTPAATSSESKASNHIIIKQAPFYVVSKTPMPSVLIELGFLSNPAEAQKLKSQAYQDQLVESISKGLLEYHQLLKKGSPSTLN